MKTSVFKSEAGRDKIRACYSEVLSRFPFGQQYVETGLGKTFILTAGQAENPPVLLLHGSCSNSAFWFLELMALSDRFRVYAVDIIGEAGNSEEYRPGLDSDAFALWMADVLAALELKQAALIGNSLGGWMALKFATAFPESISKLCLIASAGLAQIRPQFLQNVGEAQREGETAPVNSDTIGENGIPQEVLDFMNLIVQNYNPIQELPLFSDGELRRLQMPVLFIGGEDDVIIDAQSSAQRLARLVPSAEIRLLPACGHVGTGLAEYILLFLTKTDLM
ncbi:MAG TPA: alpha/beta hydrolase [Terriglobales bacterium]|nr:alpha/beta hydrolase [Terriglobales bacterium]